MNIRHSPLKTISFQILSYDYVRALVSWDETSVNIQKDKSKSMLTYLVSSFFPINVAARAITSAYWRISETPSELLNHSQIQYLQQWNENNHMNFRGW